MNVIGIVIYLAVIAGVICLQIFLSKRQNRWFGLILPMMVFLFSLIAVLSFPAFSTQGKLTVQEISSDGTVIEETIVSQQEPVEHMGTTISRAVTVFILYNIPTVLLLAIYFACREKIKKNSLLDKMNIQDLE